MSEVYAWNDRHQYPPEPCPRCGSTDVDVDWHDVGTYTRPNAWMPGLKQCLNPECEPGFETSDTPKREST